MKRMRLYVPLAYWNRDAKSDEVKWSRTVLAGTRREALNKCLPELRKLVATAPIERARFSVYVGEAANPTAFPSRLAPFQIDRQGNVVGAL